MFYSILYVLPKNLVSWLFGCFASIKCPRFWVRFVVKTFANLYKINLNEAAKDLNEFTSLNDFFTRQLKPGIRDIQSGVVHPADSVLTQHGQVNEGALVQAKGKTYLLKDFLQMDPLFKRFLNGYFFTYYLCPTDYHRVHSPVDGNVTDVQYIPGKLWPVNAWSVGAIKDLFAVNERVVSIIETPQGACALVMVGATNVGKMTLAFDPDICTNKFWNRNILSKKYHPPQKIKKGDEFGTFHMGSTVIMVYEKSFFKDAKFNVGPVQIGGSLQKT